MRRAPELAAELDERFVEHAATFQGGDQAIAFLRPEPRDDRLTSPDV
ncbi:MAG: hypothetical protein WBC44_01965 [Planctomycetaceae bacterium]